LVSCERLTLSPYPGSANFPIHVPPLSFHSVRGPPSTRGIQAVISLFLEWVGRLVNGALALSMYAWNLPPRLIRLLKLLFAVPFPHAAGATLNPVRSTSPVRIGSVLRLFISRTRHPSPPPSLTGEVYPLPPGRPLRSIVSIVFLPSSKYRCHFLYSSYVVSLFYPVLLSRPLGTFAIFFRPASD